MIAQTRVRVAAAPTTPLMIWDGDCHFCRHWIERWRVVTGGLVDYAPYQDVAAQFPEIPPEQFERSDRPSAHKDWPALLRMLERRGLNYLG